MKNTGPLGCLDNFKSFSIALWLVLLTWPKASESLKIVLSVQESRCDKPFRPFRPLRAEKPLFDLAEVTEVPRFEFTAEQNLFCLGNAFPALVFRVLEGAPACLLGCL